MNMLIATIAIIITWVVAQAVFVGIGHLIMYTCLKDQVDYLTYFLNFWIGWAFALIFLQIWSLFLPVNDLSRLLLTFVGLIGYGLCLRHYGPSLKRNKVVVLISLSLIFIIMFCLSNQALRGNGQYDAALYHYQVIRWFSEYPVVRGIVNLHDRLAFSNGYFLYPSLFNTGFWFNRVSYITNGLLYCMAICYLAFFIMKSEGYKGYVIVRTVGLLLLICMIYTMYHNVSNVSNDVPIILIGYLLGVLIWRYLFAFSEVEADDNLFPQMQTIVLLASIGVMIKFNFILIGGLSSILVILLWLWRKRHEYYVAIHGVSRSFIIALLVFIPMGVRSVLQTGYILYPITSFGGFDYSWKIPSEFAQESAEIIAVWAREPTQEIYDPMVRTEILSNYKWFPGWFNRHNSNISGVVIPFSVFLISFISIISLKVLDFLVFYVLKYKKFTYLKKEPLPIHLSTLYLLWVYWLVIVSSIIFWFFLAPDPRFLGSLLYVFSLSTLGILLILLPSRLRRIFQSIVLIALLILTIRTLKPVKDFQTFDSSYRQEIGTVILTTQSGLEIYTPTYLDLCGNAPLPCTPYFNENLGLIIPNNLGSGFTLEN